jgi:hypothetical protein
MSVPALICSAIYVIIGVLVLALAAGHRLGGWATTADGEPC